jgi:hypothetical protein
MSFRSLVSIVVFLLLSGSLEAQIGKPGSRWGVSCKGNRALAARRAESVRRVVSLQGKEPAGNRRYETRGESTWAAWTVHWVGAELSATALCRRLRRDPRPSVAPERASVARKVQDVQSLQFSKSTGHSG